MQDTPAKGTKILVDISSIPEDISLSTWMQMYNDKILLLQVVDRDREFQSYHVEDTDNLKGFTIFYKSKLSTAQYNALIKKYEKSTS